jgi:hypothetical protein
MLDFNFPEKDRNRLCPHHREFQAAVTIIANRMLGVEINEIRPTLGIFKREGGVLVNHREIVMYSSYVVDREDNPTNKASTEEMAAVLAIREVIDLFNKDGRTALASYLVPYERSKTTRHGDALNAMFSRCRPSLFAKWRFRESLKNFTK